MCFLLGFLLDLECVPIPLHSRSFMLQPAAAKLARDLSCLTIKHCACLTLQCGRFVALWPSSSIQGFSTDTSQKGTASQPSQARSPGKPPAAIDSAHLQTSGPTRVAANHANNNSNGNMAGSSTANTTSVLQKYISQELVTDVSSTINRLTGYEAIDLLKANVSKVDEALTACKKALQAAKLEYDQQLAQQSQLHREVTALLQRKSSWVPADVARFTELYAAEHATEAAVAAAKARYTATSDDVELLQLKLVDLIRERYQQEQAWSDKIRRASTWWTWGLMGLHFASFMAVYTFIEPRKRQALTAAVAGMLEQHTESIDGKLAKLADAVPAVTAQAVSASQERKHTTHKKQKHRQEDAAAGATAATQQLQAAAGVQQRVLQELEKVQQQLQELHTALPHAAASSTAVLPADSSHPGTRWWQLPGRQWASQQAAAAGSAVKRYWQAAKARSQELTIHFNPLQVLGGPQQGSAVLEGTPDSSSTPGVQPAAAVSRGLTEQPGGTAEAGGPAASTTEDAAGNTQQTLAGQQQQAGQQLQQHAERVAVKPEAAPAEGPSAAQGARAGSKGFAGLLTQLRADDSVLQVTKGQLALLGAAASACGAAFGAFLVVVARAGSGAAGSSSAAAG